MFTDFYDEACDCPQCMEGETVVDCTCVSSTSFNKVGEAIVDDLKKYGWVVMHDLTIDSSTAIEINKMAIKGTGKEGAWKSIETSE